MEMTVPPDVITETQKAMRAVASPGGTAYFLFSNFPAHIPVAAKTGTAQPGRLGYVKNKDFDGIFIAYAPADDPEIAFAGVIEYGNSGSGSAGYIAKAVFEEYFGLNKPQTPESPSQTQGQTSTGTQTQTQPQTQTQTQTQTQARTRPQIRVRHRHQPRRSLQPRPQSLILVHPQRKSPVRRPTRQQGGIRGRPPGQPRTQARSSPRGKLRIVIKNRLPVRGKHPGRGRPPVRDKLPISGQDFLLLKKLNKS